MLAPLGSGAVFNGGAVVVVPSGHARQHSTNIALPLVTLLDLLMVTYLRLRSTRADCLSIDRS